MALKYIRAKRKCRKEDRTLMPKDLFKLKGFLCAGTDNRCYKDDLEELWGVRPVSYTHLDVYKRQVSLSLR